MSDELTDTSYDPADLEVPPDWVPPAQVSDEKRPSPYAIDQILPADQRRYLKIRETFVHLTDNPVRAGVLEVALFELARKLRGPGYEPNPVEWREEQSRILMGPKPKDCDLWAPLSNDLLVQRFYGFASEPTLKRAVSWLEEHDYLFRRRMGGSRNDRVVLVNVKQVEFDQGNLEHFADVKFKPSVSGRPEAVISEPREAYFASLYEGLVDVVERASGSDGVRACRAALVLRLMLAFAEVNDRAGERIARPWTVRTLNASFPWGTKETWGKALDHLSDCGLIIRHKGSPSFLYEPNLPRILALCGESSTVVVMGSNQDTHGIKSRQASDQIQTPTGSNQDTTGIKSGQEPVLNGTEICSEIPTDMLQEKERNLAGSPVNLPSLETNKESQGYWRLKRGGGMPESLLDYKLADLAEKNPVKAAALIELAEEAFGNEATRKGLVIAEGREASPVLAAMLLRHRFDEARFPMQDPLWLSFPITDGTMSLDWEDNTRKWLVAKANSSEGTLVIEGLQRSVKAQSLELVRDAIAHRVGMNKVLLVDVDSELAEWLKSRGEIGEEILQQLTEIFSTEDPEDKVSRLFS